jgi:GxxExxY protein
MTLGDGIFSVLTGIQRTQRFQDMGRWWP